MFLRNTNIFNYFSIVKNNYLYNLLPAIIDFFYNEYTYNDYRHAIKNSFFFRFTTKNINVSKGGFFHGHALPFEQGCSNGSAFFTNAIKP